jgi:hypothetical protein
MTGTWRSAYSRMRKIVAAALLVSGVSGCSDACQNSSIATAAAPSGDRKAVLFRRDCGSTTGFSSQVSVTEPDEAPSGQGNAFIADVGHDVADAAAWGGPWVELRWVAPHQLLIRYDTKARVFRQDATVSGVTVTYEKVTR